MTERKRRSRLRAVPPPTPAESSTHESGPPLDTKGREMCTDHQNVSKGQPCPTCGRCHASSSQTGDPCRRWPIPGGGVCSSHGASTANVRKAAARRLLELSDPAITALSDVVKGAAKESDRVRAATAILDRAGLGPSSKIEVEAAPWEGVFQAVIVNEKGDEPAYHEVHRYDDPDDDEGDD